MGRDALSWPWPGAPSYAGELSRCFDPYRWVLNCPSIRLSRGTQHLVQPGPWLGCRDFRFGGVNCTESMGMTRAIDGLPLNMIDGRDDGGR